MDTTTKENSNMDTVINRISKRDLDRAMTLTQNGWLTYIGQREQGISHKRAIATAKTVK